MGIFRRLSAAPGPGAMTGVLGVGQVLDLRLSRSTVQVGNGLVARRCTARLAVLLDHRDAYVATVRQAIPEVALGTLVPGAAVPVRVDPTDEAKVVIDLTVPVPVVTLTRGSTGTVRGAWRILDEGVPAEVVVLESCPMHLRSWEGHDVHELHLEVTVGSAAPYRTRAGNAVPVEHLAHLHPGSRLPARIGRETDEVVIDWEAALIERRGRAR